ncbi:hypothetical protein [Rhodovulum viride]|uniref:hypothetical protein n=1 Tax=Rhodovulum viride TaxID=1231134 RepID=UPI0011BE8416|nr:hypothetical protein [Rhodovulum viride]
MGSVKVGKFFRVQTTGRDGKTGAFVMRHSPAGSEVVTLKRDAYVAAKKAAAKALKARKQSA